MEAEEEGSRSHDYCDYGEKMDLAGLVSERTDHSPPPHPKTPTEKTHLTLNHSRPATFRCTGPLAVIVSDEPV
ncbi:hypothetical protein Pyn_21000 [Prunus yedoensis var. nudiflora]|uniref:Uncharacterized protein n=1 Tax=Prunus yedoensis var. nudiflora TaxID=2094558 RepID=A0A314ZP52_PRUYE|nr:hypothetical protein Pyn_21000 [Prunus yedoensis var. nudiflora]